MYCTGCGTQLDVNLNFCSRCGNAVPKGGSVSVAESLAQSVGYVGGFGLLGFIFVTFVLLRKGVEMQAFVPIAFFYLAALVAICWLMLRYSSQLSHVRIDAPRLAAQETPNRLGPFTTAQLDEPRDQPASIIENTTRALDEVVIKR